MSTLVNDENVYVGYPVYARVSWEVTSAQEMVNFYVSDCSVIHDSRSISLIKEKFKRSVGRTKSLFEKQFSKVN